MIIIETLTMNDQKQMLIGLKKTYLRLQKFLRVQQISSCATNFVNKYEKISTAMTQYDDDHNGCGPINCLIILTKKQSTIFDDVGRRRCLKNE